MAPDAGKCPEEGTLLGFLNGTLKARRLGVEHHLMRCAACREVATWAATDVATVAPEQGNVGAPALELMSGARIGRYQILERIGRGGMGEVYAAYHPDLDRRIALKIVHGELAADAARQARLLREARIIARLNHPNIVAVHDAGMIGEQVYVAMEFVDGQTLDVWAREKERPWREIVEVFLAAGRGLAAAHSASVIHRDFKPQNVMIGRDGRVRVMDFGLARAMMDAPEPRPESSGAAISQLLTSTTAGALIGTPAYMAPEQLRGDPIDVRADQFSFCLALRQTIGHRAPRWMNAVLRRGLAHDRTRRYRSMPQLLRAIEAGRARLSRGLFVLGAAAFLAVMAGVAGRTTRPRQFACSPPTERLEAIWGPSESTGSRRASLHRLFKVSALPNAEGIWQRLAGILDGRARDWSAMYRDACEATHVRGEQSAEVLDLRMTCLADTLDETRAYTDRLLASKGAVLDRALSSVVALGSIQQCSDVKNLRLQFPLPQDPVGRAQVVQLQQRMNDADVLASLRDDGEAERELKAILPSARRLDFKPLVAQVLQKVSQIEDDLYHADAGRFAEEALTIAEASHDDATVAKAAEVLGFVAMEAGNFEDSRRWLTFTDAVITRLHAQGSLLHAWQLNDLSLLYFNRGDVAAAEGIMREALALKVRLLGPHHPDVGVTLANLAQILDEMDRPQEGIEAIRSALEIAERNGYGSSPIAANYALAEGEMLLHLGRLEEARIVLTGALALAKSDGRDDALQAIALADWADFLLLRNRPQDALEAVTEAQKYAKRSPVRLPIWDAALQFTVARALIDSRTETKRRVQMVAEACLTFERLHRRGREQELLDWYNNLPDHAGRPAVTSCSDLPHTHAAGQLPHQ